MTRIHSDTEEIILLAAKEIFVRKGFDSVRMEEIAQLAGVNKSALHYYFRSKKKLYDTVFEAELLKFITELDLILEQDIHLPHKIEEFVSTYINFLFENPHFPLFILNELNNNPERGIRIIKEINNKYSTVTKQIGSVSEMLNLTINLLSLCTFPFICGPFISKVLFDNNVANYNLFLHKRKEEVSNLIIQSFKTINSN